MACNGTMDCTMGPFLPNSQLLLQMVRDAEGKLDQCFVNARFAPMFDKQLRDTSHLEFHDEVMKMRITHPNIHILADRKTWVKNTQSCMWRVTWNMFRKLDTT